MQRRLLKVDKPASWEPMSAKTGTAALPTDTAPCRPTMEVNLNGVQLDMGELPANWPQAVRETAKALASAAMERALECRETHRSVVEVWSKDGRLLVAVSTTIQASWPHSG